MHPPIKVLCLATLFLAVAACGDKATETSAAQAPEPEAMTTASAPPPVATPATAATPVSAPKLQAAIRALWHGHITHARDYALAMHAHNDPDAKKASDAVVANAKEISNAIAGFYGKAGGDRMMELLGGHWGAVKAMTDARAKGDDAGANKAMADLTANASEIASFLAGANPNLPEDTVRGLMVAHGAHHAQQIQQIMADDKAGEASSWVAMQQHMDMIADALAGAIAKQFPDKAS